MKYRILIVEPSEILQIGLKDVLNNLATVREVESLYDVARLEERLLVFKPNVVVVNPTMIGTTSRSPYLQSIREREAAVVALVYQYVEQSVLRTFDAIIDVRDGQAQIEEAIAEAVRVNADESNERASGDAYELSDRETDVLVLVAKGMSSKEIADKLNISVNTVITHRKNITKKTGIKSVAGLAVYAMLNNLIV